jgi:hypothetical protein
MMTTTNAQHTWRVDTYPDGIRIEPIGFHIECDPDDDPAYERALIHARLIAAAPALLAALESSIRALQGQPSPAETRDDEWINHLITKANAAIRAAKRD